MRSNGTLIQRAVVALGVFALTVAAANAESRILVGEQDGSVASVFSLNFFEPEGPRSSNIASTNFTMAVDDVAQTAVYQNYVQHVEPLTLPGGISTGDITVLIQSSVPVSYNPGTGEFVTNDVYEIHFTGDLQSAFGITSPFILPAQSSGTLVYDTPDSGSLATVWTGQSSLPNVQNPEEPIIFEYICAVNSTFVPEPASLALLGLAGLVALRRR